MGPALSVLHWKVDIEWHFYIPDYIDAINIYGHDLMLFLLTVYIVFLEVENDEYSEIDQICCVGFVYQVCCETQTGTNL